jgi:hypothetical protein
MAVWTGSVLSLCVYVFVPCIPGAAEWLCMLVGRLGK